MKPVGVLVSYNHSEGEQANIITVAASGIKISSRWVLTHGSILSPLKQAELISRAKGKPILSDQFYEHLPEIYVTCEREDSETDYDGVAKLAKKREDPLELGHSSYQMRVLTGRICHVWQCPVLDRCVEDILYSWTIGHRDGDADKQSQLGNTLLSVFLLIDLEDQVRGQNHKPLRPLSELYDVVGPAPARGEPLEIHSTPFGNEVFLNSVSTGAVCGAAGRRPALLLTDAATALGSEGAPAFTSKQLIGIVVCSVSWWRGEWVGLTLVAPLRAVLAAKLRLNDAVKEPPPPAKHLKILESIDSSLVLVRCGVAWGAGVYLGGGYVVTCAHVVRNYSSAKVSLYARGVKETAIVRYKTADDKAYDLALLFSNPENWTHLVPAHFSTETIKKGEPVLAAGFPFFNENNLEDLRPTVTSGHANNVSPSMIQTSCCVQSGFSGGAIYRITASSRVEVLGIIVCNAKTETGACFPYINMAVPAATFVHLLHTYMHDKDADKLKCIESDKEIIQSQWRLMPYRSKM